MKELKRVLLKLSGEALSGSSKSGYDDALIEDIARQVKEILKKGIDVGVVIGGGNYWRGRSNDNIDRTKADQIGMLATVMNCIYVSEIFRSCGINTNILTPFECGSMTKLFSKDRANKYFEKGMVVFLREEQVIRISQQIRELFFALLSLMLTQFCWQRILTACMTATLRLIRKPGSTISFLYRRLLTESWA